MIVMCAALYNLVRIELLVLPRVQTSTGLMRPLFGRLNVILIWTVLSVGNALENHALVVAS